MDITVSDTTCSPSATTSWPVGARLIDALTRRDFVDLAACFTSDVHLRAVLPRAVLELRSAREVAGKFEDWFGGSDAFQLLDASAGRIGPRQYLRWRIRMCSPGTAGGPRVVEQHVFTRGSELVESLDLLCSGFQPETDADDSHPGGVR